MSLASEVEVVGGLLKKFYSTEAAQKQFYNSLTLVKRVNQKRKGAIGVGGTVTGGLHTGRNPGVGSVGNGAATPANGKQAYTQYTASLKYHYMCGQFTGPDMVNSSKNPGAFADVFTANTTGAIDDGKADLNRQLFSDGSGILALAAGDQSSTVTAIYPYLWADADKYLQTVGQRLEVYALTDFSTSNVSTASYVLNTAGTVHSNLYSTTGGFGTTTAGDIIGKYGSLQLADATTITQYECMGLDGIVSDANLIGGVGYGYDLYNSTAVTNFTGPEGQAYDYTGPGSASNANLLQGVNASSAFWRSKVMGNGGVPRALTMKMVDDMIGHLKVSQGSKLSAIYLTWQTKNKLIDLIRQDRRYTGEKMKIDGAIETDSYDGTALIVDNDCPRGRMYFVDESMLDFHVGKDFDFLKGNGNSYLWKITGYDGYEFTAAAYHQLAAKNRNRHGKIIDILE
ncbi:MAG: phage major capsid protein [Hyphomicrobium sp.]|jgi:hypothetical protein